MGDVLFTFFFSQLLNAVYKVSMIEGIGVERRENGARNSRWSCYTFSRCVDFAFWRLDFEWSRRTFRIKLHFGQLGDRGFGAHHLRPTEARRLCIIFTPVYFSCS